MRKFDTKVQYLKYKVLREVARHAFEDRLADAYIDIPYAIVPGNEPTMRCCVYKERAIVNERIHMAMGGFKENPNVIEVIDIACDECPEAGYVVTDLCRGCLAHHCVEECKRNAIVIDEHQHAKIDKSKCVECGKCAKACKYSAIHNFQRPCENACKVGAISMAPGGEACIDYDACIDCGACVYHCPFGAPVDKSSIVTVIKELKAAAEAEAAGGENKLIAIVAPAIASQFQYVPLGKVITGIKKLGFAKVLEVAVGADMVAYKEGLELVEKGFLTSSCCPAFVKYIETKHPAMIPHISHNLSPMAELGRSIKEHEPDVKIVFIGPCIAKKAEIKKETVSPYVDYVITFEELQALFDSRDILLRDQEITEWNQASYYGRMFATSGGVAAAVAEILKEMKVDDFELNAISCDGIDKCKTALLKASKGVLPNNFIEGMVCMRGCVGGMGNPTWREDISEEIEEHAEEAEITEILTHLEL